MIPTAIPAVLPVAITIFTWTLLCEISKSRVMRENSEFGSAPWINMTSVSRNLLKWVQSRKSSPTPLCHSQSPLTMTGKSGFSKIPAASWLTPWWPTWTLWRHFPSIRTDCTWYQEVSNYSVKLKAQNKCHLCTPRPDPQSHSVTFNIFAWKFQIA